MLVDFKKSPEIGFQNPGRWKLIQ